MRDDHSVTVRLTALLAFGTLIAACGEDGNPGPNIGIERAVVGEAPAGADAAVYFDVTGGDGVALVGAASPVAQRGSLHTMEPVEGGGVMRPTDRIVLDEDPTVLAPLGTHVMLEGLEADLVDGATVAVTLDFDGHDDIVVSVDVVPLADLAERLPG